MNSASGECRYDDFFPHTRAHTRASGATVTIVLAHKRSNAIAILKYDTELAQEKRRGLSLRRVGFEEGC